MDGLKARLSFDAVAYDYDDEYLTIDTDTHTININNVSRLFGVQYDGNSKLIKFKIRNKLSDIQKMQDSIVYINWIDSRGVKGQSIAINKTINNDTCEFAWKVPFDALKNSGVLHFAMSAVMTKNSSSVIDQRWSTQIASVITPDGIYIKSYTPSSEEEDRIAQIYNELSNMINKQNDNLQSQVNSLKEDLDDLNNDVIKEKLIQYLKNSNKEVGKSYYIGSGAINPYSKATQQIWKPIQVKANVSYYLIKITPSNSGFIGIDGNINAIGDGDGEHNVVFKPTQDGELYICNNITSGNAMVVNTTNYDDLVYILNNKTEGTFKITYVDAIQNGVFDKLKGKTWCVIGDSLTSKTGDALTQSDMKYYDWLKSNNTVIINDGKSGTGYLQTYNGKGNFIDRINELTGDENYDIISVFGGINDSTTYPIGNRGDTSLDTMYGAIYNVFNNLIAKFPTKFIFAITPTVTEYRHGYNNDIDKIAQAIRDVCEDLKIPVADVNKDASMRPWIESFKNKYYADGTHPNNDGQFIISEVIKKVFDYMF